MRMCVRNKKHMSHSRVMCVVCVMCSQAGGAGRTIPGSKVLF